MKIKITQLSLLMATMLCCITSFSQQGIGYYPNMDGGLGKQTTGNLGTTKDTIKWSYSSANNGQVRLISSTGGYGGPKYLTVGKSTSATAGSSTSISTNQVYKNTFLANTLYVVQFHYKANPTSTLTPDSASFVFISADGTSGARKSKQIKLATPSTWTKFYDTVRTDNVAIQTNTGVAGINIKTPSIGTAALVDVDNYVIYPADNQVAGGADIIAPDPVTGANAAANSPADINVSWNAPSTGVDSGGYVVVRYTVNPSGTDNPLQNAIYAVGDSVNFANKGTIVYTGKASDFLDNYNIAGGTTYYYKIYAVDKAFNYATAVNVSAATQSFTSYYYNGTGSLTNIASWGTNANGSGTAPTDFTSPGHYFIIKNTAIAIVDAPWTVAGSASKVILGDGTAAITLNIPAGNSFAGKLDIVAPPTGKNAILLNGGVFPTLGTVTGITDLNVGTNMNATIPKAQWGNVVIASPSNVVINMTDTLFVTNFTVNAGSIFSTTTIGLSNNTIAPVTIAASGAVIINGTFKTGKTGGFVAALNYLGTANTTLGANSTIVCDKVSTGTVQTISAIQYANLELAGTSPKAFEAGNLKVSGNLLISTTGKINTPPTNLELNGTSLQKFDGLKDTAYSDVTFSGGGLKKLNSKVTINGAVTFTSGKVSIDTDTLTFNSAATIGSGSASSYLLTGNNATGRVIAKGIGATSTISIPVGSPLNYLPVTLTPSQGSDFAIAAFDGLTTDGSFGGTAVDAATKAESIDAFWDISRPSGTGTVLVEVAWPASIEGSSFSSATNTQIGLQHFAGVWAVGSMPKADNVVNNASDSFTTFSPFTVSKISGLLPICKIDLQTAKVDNVIKIYWNTSCEINVKEFIVEKSLNGVEFNPIITVAAIKTTATQKSYKSIDNSINANIIYYRIKVIDNNGKIEYSKVVAIKTTTKNSFEVVANPVLGKELKVQLNNLQKGNYTIEIFNASGKKVQQVNLALDNNNLSKTIQLNELINTGLYFVKLSGLSIAETNAVFVK
jgi:hypothetical protein